MSAYPLLLMLLVAALGLVLAAYWSRRGSSALLQWYAIVALALAASALEFFLLSSQLALRLPWLAALGLPFPLLLGPLWWRAHSVRRRWSLRRWLLALFPGTLACTAAVLGLFSIGIDALATAGALPAQILLFLGVVTALLCQPRAEFTARDGSRALVND